MALPSESFPLLPSSFRGNSRVVEAGACFEWFRHGWATYVASPVLWLFIALGFVLVLLFLAMLPGVGKWLSCFLFPALAAGVLLFCRQQAEGNRLGLLKLPAFLWPHGRGLAILGGLCMALMLAMGLCLKLLDGGETSFMFGSGVGVALLRLVGGGLLMLLVSLPFVMALWFAPVLLVFHGMSPVEAMKSSFAGCLKNWLVFLVFGLLCSIFLFFVALSLGLGFLILIPVLSGAVYASYRDIFVGI
ncbi:MAG: BPSS1780 family membrane protein [Azovibrio sp.]